MASDNITCKIDQLLDNINASEKTQTDIDTLYDNFVTIIKDEMENKLSKKIVKLREGVSNKRRRRRKEWWNSELTELWNNLCEAEENWLKSSGRDKQNEF
jgi:hypothetical protein